MESFIQQVINGLQLGLMYALIALGYTMVYGTIGLINFAHGDVFMIGAFVGYLGYSSWGLPWPVAIIVSMAVCAALGVIIERIAYRPLRYAPKIAALISAIGVSFFLEYGSSLKFIFGPDYRVVQRPFRSITWNLGGVSITNIQVVIMAVVIIFLLFLLFLVFKTKIGAAMRTVSFDHDAARLMGVDVDKTISFTFAIGSALAAVGGVLYAIAYPQIYPFMGIMPGLKAFTAAVLGGIGQIPGAVLGSLIMGQVETMTAAYISSQLRDAIAFAILILVLLIRPSGILGRSQQEKI
ncbi:MAG TPA: branched-chain amino acid ABC transporter permease [Syntrophomonadaceae bacterium]|nr:branched-chain amino acid ABC transporter permease [Syntrophomonadaceae bacterium]